MAGRVAREFGAKPSLDFQIDGQWPGADQGHVAFEDIHKLRQFIEAQQAEDLADRRDAVVVPLNGLRRTGVSTIEVQCTELEYVERFVVETKPLLLEQDGAGT